MGWSGVPLSCESDSFSGTELCTNGIRNPRWDALLVDVHHRVLAADAHPGRPADRPCVGDGAVADAIGLQLDGVLIAGA